jgi:hypothetical protein
VGSQNFCSRAIPSARAFNRRFCDAMSEVKKTNHYIRVTLTVFTVFRLLTDFVCLYNYEF